MNFPGCTAPSAIAVELAILAQIALYRRLVFGQSGREIMTAVALAGGNEEDGPRAPWLRRCTYGSGARQRDRCRGESRTRVRVVRRVATQILTANVAVIGRTDAVDHRRVGLQPHAALQAFHEHPAHQRTFAIERGLLLYDGCQDQYLVGAGQWQVLRARLPSLLQL